MSLTDCFRFRRWAWHIAAGTLLTGLGVTGAHSDESPTIEWTRQRVVAGTDAPRGYLEYQNSCSVCHGPMPERPGTRALAAKYHGSVPALLEDRTDLAATYIRYTVRTGVSLMPPFRKTELSDAQLDAIVAYLNRSRPAAGK